MQFYLQGQPQPTNGTHRPYNGSTTRTGWRTCAKTQVSSPGGPRAATGHRPGGGTGHLQAPPAPLCPLGPQIAAPLAQPEGLRLSPPVTVPSPGSLGGVGSTRVVAPVFLGAWTPPSSGPGAREGQLGVLRRPGPPPPPAPKLCWELPPAGRECGGSPHIWGGAPLPVWGAQGSVGTPPGSCHRTSL